MAGLVPRLSGSLTVYPQGQLIWVGFDWLQRLEEPVDQPPMHQICAYQAREFERACYGALRGLGHSQDKKGDQRDGDLNARTAFSDIPMKRLICSVCLIHRKNNSICQRCL